MILDESKVSWHLEYYNYSYLAYIFFTSAIIVKTIRHLQRSCPMQLVEGSKQYHITPTSEHSTGPEINLRNRFGEICTSCS